MHAGDLFGQPVTLDLRFHQPEDVMGAKVNHLAVMESTDREPYNGAEHQSRRSYILARAD